MNDAATPSDQAGSVGSLGAKSCLDCHERLKLLRQLMRDMSRHTDPQEMVQAASKSMRQLFPSDRFLSVSNRNLAAPAYRVTRASHWEHQPNPWKEAHLLPIRRGGVLGELLNAGQFRIIDDLQLAPDDPAAAEIGEHRSLMAIPMIDDGPVQNMLIPMRRGAHAFRPEELPDWALVVNLFGRATQTLLLRQKVEEALAQLDHELNVVSEMQRSLLPADLPVIDTLGLASYYQTSRYAGGDYFDFFRYPDGKVGVLLADVSGHGTPAAVLMAITHAVAHGHPGPPSRPSELLRYLNDRLTELYTTDTGRFVTAFYAVYDPASRQLRYSSAGHNPPRLQRAGQTQIDELSTGAGLPLGVLAEEDFADATLQLHPGDRLVFYTDGITEARNPARELFGTERLDAVLRQTPGDENALLQAIVKATCDFCECARPDDDRTLLTALVR